MLLSSCVIWRFREWDDFRAECPTGDERLQRVVWEQLDDGIAWLESLGAPVVRHETGNPRTVGKRFDPRGLTETLVRAAGDVRLGETTARAGDPRDRWFPGRRGPRRGAHRPAAPLRLRANPWSGGTGCGSRWPRVRSCPPGWTSSTAATCRMPISRRSSSSRWRSSTVGSRASSTSAARSSSRARSHGRRTTSCRRLLASPARGRGTSSTTQALEEPARRGRRSSLAPTRVEPSELPFEAPRGRARRSSRQAGHHAHDRRRCASTSRRGRRGRWSLRCRRRRRAGSRRAATRAGWPPRSCSAASRPRRQCVLGGL